MSKIKKLGELAKILRSKNAKPYLLTFDIIFEDCKTYQKVKDSKIINRELVAKLYGLEELEEIKIYEYDPASAIKITIPRLLPAGSVGDSDLLGAQQHAPLYDIEFNW